jgi:hypothetical protein
VGSPETLVALAPEAEIGWFDMHVKPPVLARGRARARAALAQHLVRRGRLAAARRPRGARGCAHRRHRPDDRASGRIRRARHARGRQGLSRGGAGAGPGANGSTLHRASATSRGAGRWCLATVRSGRRSVASCKPRRRGDRRQPQPAACLAAPGSAGSTGSCSPCPAPPTTKGAIGAAELAAMKPEAGAGQFRPGRLRRPAALVEALRARRSRRRCST